MSDDLRIFAVPALSDNYVWLLADASGAAIAVDPGDAAPVRAALEREKLRLSAVLLIAACHVERDARARFVRIV